MEPPRHPCLWCFLNPPPHTHTQHTPEQRIIRRKVKSVFNFIPRAVCVCLCSGNFNFYFSLWECHHSVSKCGLLLVVNFARDSEHMLSFQLSSFCISATFSPARSLMTTFVVSILFSPEFLLFQVVSPVPDCLPLSFSSLYRLTLDHVNCIVSSVSSIYSLHHGF